MIGDRRLAAAIAGRQSVRRFLPQPVAPAMVERLISAAARAPSAHNRQPWRFAVLEDAASKQRLAEAMGKRLRMDRTADGDATAAIEADVSRSYARITEAPVIIVVCLDIQVMDHYPDSARNGAEYLMAVQSTAMAAQNLMLAAHSEGLGACVMCAPLFCPDIVTGALRVPDEWKPQMLITVGIAERPTTRRPRLPLHDTVLWLSRGVTHSIAG